MKTVVFKPLFRFLFQYISFCFEVSVTAGAASCRLQSEWWTTQVTSLRHGLM